MTTAETAIGGGLRNDNGYQDWPGIVSRFQLVLLAGRRSKQLYNGADPRIPADPLKRRNTSIALEELRQGLVPFRADTRNAPQPSLTAIDIVAKPAGIEHATEAHLPKAE